MKRVAAAKRGLFPLLKKSTRTLQRTARATPACAENLECRRLLASGVGIFRAPPTSFVGPVLPAESPIEVVQAGSLRSDFVGPVRPAQSSRAGAQQPATDGDAGPAFFQLNSRWTSTATNGGGLQQGQPTTLRWSVVPDGTALPSGGAGAGEPASPSNLRARLNALYGNQATWQPLIQQALDNWSANTGLTYIFEPNDDGVAITNTTANPGIIGTRGDVRIGGHTIDGNGTPNGNILAYNYFPNVGDMVIDTADNTFNNTGGSSIIFRNVITHEQGHGIGMNHVDPVNQTKLMEPFLSTAFTGAQFDDIFGANRHYGDRLEKIGGGNDTFANATPLGTLNNGTVNTNTISVDDDSDIDFFSFTVTSSKAVTITATPIGGVYLQGPQGSGGSSFNASAQGDLTLQLRASDGTTILASSNIGGPGTTETISNFNLAAGTYFIRMSSVTNAAQMYNLATTIANPTISATIVAVAPDPRTTPVSSITINFSEAVNGFDIGDLTLTRDGFSESLAGASLTGGPASFTLGNLSGLTDRVGTFTLTIVAAGSGIVAQSNGNPLNANVTESWIMQGLNGTAGNDVLRVAKNAGNPALTDVFFNSGVVTYSYNTTGINQLVVSGSAGDDVFAVDFTNGSPLPASGATYDGGAHTTGDTLRQIGGAASDAFSMSASAITRTSPATPQTSFSNTEILDLNVGTYTSGVDLNGFNVIVGNQGVAQFNATQHLNSLTINNGGRANMGFNGNRILVTNALSIGATGLLDLFDNDMLVEYTGGSPAATIQSWITSGRTGGSWLGFGIVSTAARNAFPMITTLGLLEGFQYDAMRGVNEPFTGENPDATSVLVKYTYYGDTDFNGRVNFDDYSRVDSGFLTGLSGWMNGDFNDNGVINFDDYALIDQAFLSQGGVVL